jgi:hypothetical protein
MVDTRTWNRLDDAARREFHDLFHPFQDALRDAGVHDGYDLGRDWSVQRVNGAWTISNGSSILEGVTSSRREVIEALYKDGIQNLNR